MEEARKIMRRSIHIFLQNYHRFTTVASSLALPFAVALLLSQPFSSSSSSSSSFLLSQPFSSVLSSIHTTLTSLFRHSHFPPSLNFFNILSLKLSQTLCSSLFILPFSLTFFLFSKAYVIILLGHNLSASKGFLVYYFSLLHTYICNSFFLLSANASAFALFFLAFNLLQGFGFSSKTLLTFLSLSAAVIYSIILANALVISNLALVLSAAERSASSSSSSSGYMAILKACVLIRGKTSTALALALPTNLGLAGVEALFRYRIVKSYIGGHRDIASLVLEGMFIAYLYAIFLVLDTVVNFLFCQSCTKDQEEGYSFIFQIYEPESLKRVGSKDLEEVP